MKRILKYLLIAVLFVAAILSLNYSAVTTGIAIVAMASIVRSETLDRSGNSTKFRIYLLHVDSEVDIDNVPFPNREMQTMSDIPRNSGKYWHYIDAIVNSVVPKFSSSGDDGIQISNEIEVKLGGLKTEVRRFLNNYKGESFFVVWEVCSGSQAGKKFIAGTKCSGMTMTISEGGWLAESTGATIIFKNSCPEIPYEYIGNVTQVPAVVVASNSTQIVVGTSNEYQLSDNSTETELLAVSGLSSADHGRVLTFIAPATENYPTEINSGGSFVLLNGASFVANSGKKISLRIFKDGDSSFKLIEVDGSRL